MWAAGPQDSLSRVQAPEQWVGTEPQGLEFAVRLRPVPFPSIPRADWPHVVKSLSLQPRGPTGIGPQREGKFRSRAKQPNSLSSRPVLVCSDCLNKILQV